MARLLHASDEEVLQELPALLEWLQDGNWPVFYGVCERLSHLGPEIIPPLRKVLESDDPGWIYWIVTGLLPNSKEEVRDGVSDIIDRMVLNPAPSEQNEEITGAAQKLFNSQC